MTYGSAVLCALDANTAGYPIAGFIRELYEGAEVYIPPLFVEGLFLSPRPGIAIQGTILSVLHPTIMDLNKSTQFVIEDGDLQIPLAFGGDRICFFKIQKIPGGESPENTPGEVIEF